MKWPHRIAATVAELKAVLAEERRVARRMVVIFTSPCEGEGLGLELSFQSLRLRLDEAQVAWG